MNKKTMKRIHRKAEDILKGWLLSLLPDEEADINRKNIKEYLPDQQYFYAGKSLRLSNYSYKWVCKLLKKMHKAGVDIKPMTYADFNNLYRRYLV